MAKRVNYLEKLGLNSKLPKTEKVLRERVRHLEQGIAQETWKGVLREKAEERLMWFRRELRLLQEGLPLKGVIEARQEQEGGSEELQKEAKKESKPKTRVKKGSIPLRRKAPSQAPVAQARRAGGRKAKTPRAKA